MLGRDWCPVGKVKAIKCPQAGQGFERELDAGEAVVGSLVLLQL